MKVALIYDRVNKWGGAERVLLALHELFPNAPLFTSVYDPQRAPWAKQFVVKTSFLQKIPFASSWHEGFATLMPLAFESFSFDDYDLVISVTSEAAKGVITKPKTAHICYCLTPTRYLWSGYDEYFNNSIFRFLSKPAISYLREWDIIAAQRPDAYIAISKEVQTRIKKYYGRESEVVYPPVTLASSNQRLASSLEEQLYAKGYTLNASGYFLVVSRLVPYKRIDIAIEACNALQLPLVIIGSGSEEKRLKKIAGNTITFVGSLTDNELVEYYKACRALIFPGFEDFGLSIVEAQSFGKPVIALREGGALEIVRGGKTGLFFYPQTTVACKRVLQAFDTKMFSQNVIMQNSKTFSSDRFKKEFLDAIEQVMMQRKKNQI